MALGERDVTVTIKVKDGEVVAAEGRLNRLKKAAKDVGTGGGQIDRAVESAAKRSGRSYEEQLAVIAKNAPQAEKAIQAVTEATAGSAEASSAAVASVGALVGIIAIAVVGLLAFVAVTAKVAHNIYEDVKAFATYGAQIGEMSDDTGLATETVSALNAELEAQAKSFSALKGPINEFRKLIGQAAGGSVDAQQKLTQLGIDGSKAIYDIDTAFKSVIATLVQTRNPADQARLGFAVFGSEWVKLQPILRDFPGDVDAVIRKAEELGIVMSGKDVKAAKELNRTFSDLQNTIKGIETQLGRDFLPVVRDLAREIADFIARHRTGIISLAESFGNAAVRIIQGLESIIKWIDDHPTLFGVLGRFFDYAATGGVIPVASTPPTPRQPRGPQLYDYSRPEDMPTGGPDLAALDAKRAQQEKELQAQIEKNKQDWDAAIKLWEGSAEDAGSTLLRIFGDLKDKLEKGGSVQDFVKGVNQATSAYLNTISNVEQQLNSLENEKARRDKTTDNQRAVLLQSQNKREIDLRMKGVEVQKQANDLVTANQKKASEQQLRDFEEGINRKNQLDAARTATAVAKTKLEFDLKTRSEKEYIDFVNAAELGDANLRLQRAQEYLEKVKGNKKEEASAELQVALVKAQVAQQEVRNSERTLDYETRKREAAEKLKKVYEDLRDSLQDQLDELLRGGRPLTEYEKTVRDLARDYKDLDPAQKQNLLNIAAEIDSVKALQAEYEKVKDTIKTVLDYVLRGDFKGLGRSLLDSVRNSISDKLSGVLATIITGFDPNATNNPVAKPIVKEISGTNKRLDQVIKLLGGTPGTAALGGLGGILSGINGGSLGGLGGGGTIGGGGSAGGGQGGSILDRLRNIFSTNEGGIFAPRSTIGGGSSRMGGILGGIGDLAVLAGGVIGGRVGGILSAAGTGASIGAMFGPWGAVIGAGVGALFGILAGDPKRKEDKKKNIPALQKGFGDSITELNKILEDIRFLRVDPDEAISRATAVRAEIASGFGIQFQSKKYRKQSQQMIASKLVEADRIIAEIRSSAEIARGAADRSKRILPEFAGGHYFADFFRPNGLLPGMFDGRDSIFAMISRGEMVLNPRQQGNVRALAGFDVFAGAGIPNYPKASSSPKLATGGIAGAGLTLATPPVIVQPNFRLELVGVSIDTSVKAYLVSDDGRRTQVEVNKTLKRRGDI